MSIEEKNHKDETEKDLGFGIELRASSISRHLLFDSLQMRNAVNASVIK